ncbi:hypothetical protein [Pleurocapsa sp. PCC 7319]|uniref:hypothetical protein n=1 Tax=Pleurocapsa sp. PCC 7319 TaxID=118161 RepID=UPI0011819283|nr:hypothetical protein [Pleurocapsa sp. PCC 7319]
MNTIAVQSCIRTSLFDCSSVKVRPRVMRSGSAVRWRGTMRPYAWPLSRLKKLLNPLGYPLGRRKAFTQERYLGKGMRDRRKSFRAPPEG